METLTSVPESVEEVLVSRTLNTVGSGMVQRRNVYQSHYPFLRQFNLTWNSAGLNERNQILDLFENTKSSGAFLWTAPNSSTAIKVRFLNDKVNWVGTNGSAYQIQIQLEELR